MLASVNINHGFYENTRRPALYGQFCKENRELIDRLETEADAQLKAAFPNRYEEIVIASGSPESLMHEALVATPSLQSDLIRGDSQQEVSAYPQ